MLSRRCSSLSPRLALAVGACTLFAVKEAAERATLTLACSVQEGVCCSKELRCNCCTVHVRSFMLLEVIRSARLDAWHEKVEALLRFCWVYKIG